VRIDSRSETFWERPGDFYVNDNYNKSLEPDWFLEALMDGVCALCLSDWIVSPITLAVIGHLHLNFFSHESEKTEKGSVIFSSTKKISLWLFFFPFCYRYVSLVTELHVQFCLQSYS